MPDRWVEVIVPQVSMRSTVTLPAVDPGGRPIQYSSVVTEGTYTFILDKPLGLSVGVPLDATEDDVTRATLQELQRFMSNIVSGEARRRLDEMKVEPVMPEVVLLVAQAQQQYKGL